MMFNASSNCIVLMAALTFGCTHSYQTIGALSAPAAVDPTAPNLRGQLVHIQCVPGVGQRQKDADTLCRHVGALFRAQGAQVDLTTDALADQQPDLVMTLVSSVTRHGASPAVWVACVMSTGLLTATIESGFAIDTTIADADGFLLERTRIEGRVLSRFGWSAWLGTALDSRAWRSGSTQRTRAAVGAALSDDVYGQLSQLANNAATYRAVVHASVDAGTRP